MKSKILFRLMFVAILMSVFTQSSLAQHGFSLRNNENDEFIKNTVRELMADDWVYVGDTSSPWGSYNFPIDFYGKTSLSQSIYTQEEINHGPCLITDVQYTYKTVSTNYPDEITGEQFRIWLSNTSASSLAAEDGFWLPPSDFTLVYEGSETLYSGENLKLTFTLDEPFVYNGENLCIMVERVLSEEEYQNHFNFFASTLPENEKRARVYWSFDTSFDFNQMPQDPNDNNFTGMTLGHIADVELGIESNNGGNLSGMITNSDNEAIEGAMIQILNTDLVTYSDSNGNYSFDFLTLGEHQMEVSAFGYVTQQVTVNIDGDVTQNVQLENLPSAILTGKVVDKDNNPIPMANIMISGYAPYEAMTDDNGEFSIENVLYADNYTLITKKENYVTDTTMFSVNSPTVTLDDIQLMDKLTPPSKVEAEVVGENCNVSWVSPENRIEYRYDGGNQVLQLAHNYNEDLAVFGTVFREPAALFKATWYTHLADVNEPHDFVNLFIFALDENGLPTNTILFEKRDIPNVDDTWSEYLFEEPLMLDNGFMVALSFKGRLEIGIDDGLDPEYPYVNNVNYMAENFTNNQFQTLESLTDQLGPIPGNFMVRAEGYANIDKTLSLKNHVEEKSLNHFKVYRFPQDQIDNQEEWTLLADNVVDENFTDETFSTVDAGWYRYAVKSVYSGGNESEPAFSNAVSSGLTTKITFNINTNTEENESLGAKITLKNTNNNSDYVYVKYVENNDGIVVFDNVFKGTYDINVELEGFETISQNDEDFSTEDTYNQSHVLTEILEKPYNLEVITGEQNIFNWNVTQNIFDDFESYNNFELEPSREVEWTYLDLDQKPTVGIDNFEFLNEHSITSYMVFVPNATNPPIDLELNPTIAPFSGNKYLCSFGTTYGENNDYIISPKLNFCKNFTFAFHAKSFSGDPKLNKIRVGYSNTSNNPEDFTWLTDEPIELPSDKYYQYSYDLTKDVKYVCINNVSDGGYILMIDDIKLTAENTSKNRHLIAYKVYLDGEYQGETQETTFELNIPEGRTTYEAGVEAVYSSGTSERATINFDVIANHEVEKDNVQIYPIPANNIVSIKGNFDKYFIYDMTGKQVKFGQLKQQQINVSNLANGIYTITLINNKETVTQRLVIKH